MAHIYNKLHIYTTAHAYITLYDAYQRPYPVISYVYMHVCTYITRAKIPLRIPLAYPNIYSAVYKPPKANYIIYTSTHYIQCIQVYIIYICIVWQSASCPSHKLQVRVQGLSYPYSLPLVLPAPCSLPLVLPTLLSTSCARGDQLALYDVLTHCLDPEP